MPVRSLTTARCIHVYIHLFSTDKRMQMDSRTRTTFQTHSANQRRERRNPKLTKLVLTLALTTRGILLAALLKCVRRTGVCEIPWADVSHQHHLYSGVFADTPRQHQVRQPSPIACRHCATAPLAGQPAVSTPSQVAHHCVRCFPFPSPPFGPRT
jgi:hypothetical protein